MNKNSAADYQYRTLHTLHHIPASIGVVAVSVCLIVCLRAYHVWSDFMRSGYCSILLLGMFWLCSCIAVALAFRCKAAWYTARVLSCMGLVLFTIGLIAILYYISKGYVNPPLSLLVLTTLNPLTAYALFISLGRPMARMHFNKTADPSLGKCISIAVMIGCVMTGGLYATILGVQPRKYYFSADRAASVSFEIRKAYAQFMPEYSSMNNQRTGETVYIHPESQFSNRDIRSTSLVQGSPGDPNRPPMIVVSFNDDATTRLTEFTSSLVPPVFTPPNYNRPLMAILIDGQVWVAAAIREPLYEGQLFLPYPFEDKQDLEHIAECIIGTASFNQ